MPNWKQCSECDKWIVDKQYGMCYDCYEDEKEQKEHYKKISKEKEKENLRKVGLSKLLSEIS